MKNKETAPVKSKDYVLFLQDIKNKITNARISAYKSLNKELINLY